MKLAVLKDRRTGEARVAATPETVKKLKGLGLEIVVETGAGSGARISDAEYEAAGASIADSAASGPRDADVVLTVRSPDAQEIAAMKRGAVLAALLAPYTEKDAIGELAQRGVVAFAMEFIP